MTSTKLAALALVALGLALFASLLYDAGLVAQAVRPLAAAADEASVVVLGLTLSAVLVGSGVRLAFRRAAARA